MEARDGWKKAPPDKRGGGGRAEQDRHSGMPLRPTLTTSAGLTRYDSFACHLENAQSCGHPQAIASSGRSGTARGICREPFLA